MMMYCSCGATVVLASSLIDLLKGDVPSVATMMLEEIRYARTNLTSLLMFFLQCDKCGKLLNSHELIDPKCKLCSSRPEPKSSAHLFLDLPKIEPTLRRWIDQQSVAGAWTQNSVNITQSWLKGGLRPRCITRDLRWGTPVPLDGYRDKVFYVWFDAPIGYISITAAYTADWKMWWKASKHASGFNDSASSADSASDDESSPNVELVQFMGKDNVPFHCVIFPSTLIGANDNFTLLHHISTTEYLNYESGKFSKSRGVGVFGDGAKASGIPSEQWRYYLLQSRPESTDSTFNWSDFQSRVNNELLKNFGNLCQRLLSFVAAKLNGTVGPISLTEADSTLISNVTEHVKTYCKQLEAVSIREGLTIAMATSSLINQYLQWQQPWSISESDRPRCDTIAAVACNCVLTVAILLEPYMPSLSQRVFQQLAFVPAAAPLSKFDEYQVIQLQTGHRIGQPSILVNPIPDDLVQRLRLEFGGEEAKMADFPVDLAVGKVLEVADHPAAEHLYVCQIDCGESKARQVVTGLKAHYTPDQLLSGYVACVLNLKATNFKSVRSEGLILTAVSAESVKLVRPTDAAKPGDRIIPQGFRSAPKKNFDLKKELPALKLIVGEEGACTASGAVLQVAGHAVVAPGAVSGVNLQ